LARFAIMFSVAVMTLLFWFPRDGRYVHPPTWWGILFLGFVGVWVTAALGGLVIACFMKCDRCGRRPTIMWRITQRPAGVTKMQAFRDFFFPSEIRLKAFECAHCGVRFRLSP
jgi:hypothetical protein